MQSKIGRVVLLAVTAWWALYFAVAHGFKKNLDEAERRSAGKPEYEAMGYEHGYVYGPVILFMIGACVAALFVIHAIRQRPWAQHHPVVVVIAYIIGLVMIAQILR